MKAETLPIHRLTKQQLVWMANHTCKKHRHKYLEHYQCYLNECQIPERVGYLDIECTPPGTLILTKQGLKKVEDITTEDYVLTHKNRWQKVTATKSRFVDEDLIAIGDGHTSVLHITKNHPLYVVNLLDSTSRGVFDQQRGVNINRLAPPIWREAKDISKESALLVGIINNEGWKTPTSIDIGEPSYADRHHTSNIPSKIHITPLFLKVIGLFIGDGCATDSVIEFFSGNKDEEFRQIINAWAQEIGATNLTESKDGNMYRQRICSTRLGRFFRSFYNSVGDKTIPLEWLNTDDDSFDHIIKGLLLADGYQYKQNKCALSTTSQELMERLVIRSAHSKNFRIRYYKYQNQTSTIKGREFHPKPYYILCFYTDDPIAARHKRQWRIFDYILKRPMYVDKYQYKGLVYNLSVAEDESYIANGFVVHNCSNLDADFGIVLSWCILDGTSGKIHNGVLTKDDIDSAKLGQEDKRIVKELIECLGQYDRIVTYYGKNFDVPFIRARALIDGIKFPNYGSLLHTDLYFVIKSRFKLSSKRLENACRVLLGKTQKTRINTSYWRAAVRGCKKALDYVLKHNKYDVLDLEKLYKKVINFSKKNDQSM